MYNLKSQTLLPSKKHQKGASLIELMVGITVGLLVVLAAVGTLMFTSVSSSASSDVTRLQQKSEIFFRLFRFQVEQAGAISISSPTLSNEVRFGSEYTGLDSVSTGYKGTGLPVTAQVSVHGTDGASSAADILRIAYQHEDNGRGDGRDCLGNSPPTADKNIRVIGVYRLNTATAELMCEGGNATTGEQALIDGVEDFQVTYGVKTYPVKTPLDPSTYTYSFLRADQVTQWELVTAVSICLQLQGDSTNNPQVGTVLGCSGNAVATDGRLHRTYSRIYSLRNALL
jgi:type IV pilus assembly protein PilW